MAKMVTSGDMARTALMRGIDAVANVVKVTLGPRGRNVIISRKNLWGTDDEETGAVKDEGEAQVPTILNDGVQIVRDFELAHRFHNLGAQLVKQVAAETNGKAGDGTTTAAVLAQAMARTGMKFITAGAEPFALKRGMEKAQEIAVAQFRRMTKPLETPEEMREVAGLSAKDDAIGELIGKCIAHVGRDGAVTIEDSSTIRDQLEFVDGMNLGHGSGYVSPYFITDYARQEAVLEKCYILFTDKAINSIDDLLPALEKLMQVSKTLLIICDSISGEALNTLVVNKMNRALNVCAVKMPGISERRRSRLEDMAIATGGRVLLAEKGRNIRAVSVSDFGRAQKIVVGAHNTTVIKGVADQEDLNHRIEALRDLAAKAYDDIDRQSLLERIAKLSGSIAMIKVGAPTEAELKDKKLRIEDALAAVRAGIEDGIVPGGGITYLKASFPVQRLEEQLEGDERLGAQVVRQALSEPLRCIAQNAGEHGGTIVNMVQEIAGPVVFDARTLDFVDAYAAGILEPLKVPRYALESAVSIVSTLLTTHALVTWVPGTEDDDHEAFDPTAPFKRAMRAPEPAEDHDGHAH